MGRAKAQGDGRRVCNGAGGGGVDEEQDKGVGAGRLEGGV